MGWIFRWLGILLLTVLVLLGALWAVAVFTDLPARVVTTGFNEEHGELWLETRGARLHPDLMGVHLDGLALSERAKKDALVQVERVDAALGAWPSDDLVSVEHLDVDGLRVDLDPRRVATLRALTSPVTAPPETSRKAGLVRLGRVRLRDASLAWRDPARPVDARGLDVELRGVLGSSGDLTLTGAVASLVAGPWTAEGLRLGELALAWSGLQGSLVLKDLAAARLAGPRLALVDARLALEAAGGVAGLTLTRLELVSPGLGVRLSGSARLALGLMSRGLDVSLQGTFEATPAALLPEACGAVSRAAGSFRLGGDVLKGGLALQALEIVATTAEGERRLTRDGGVLAQAASVGALAAELCAEAGARTP